MIRTIIYSLICFILLLDVKAQDKQLKFTRINSLEEASIGQVNFITEDKYGFIWMSEESNGALTRFDGHNIKRYKYEPGKENALGGPYPECLMIDKEGYIWIGFFGYGLDRFDPLTETFIHYKHDPKNSNSLSHNSVSALVQDQDGKIFIATFDGMDVLDPKTGKFTHFKHDPEDSNSISSNYVREIYKDREGAIWAGTGWFAEDSKGGLNRFDKKTGKFTRYTADPTNPNALSNDRITTLFEDSRGTFWVGTGDALYSLNRKDDKFTRHISDSKNPNSIGAPLYSDNSYGVTFISEDIEGNLWIGGEGCIVYNPESKTMTHYGNNSDSYGTFIENSSWCIHMGSNGLIWLSTQPGIYKIDPYNYTIPRKMEVIPAFLIDLDTISWTGVENGLLRENLLTGSKKQWIHDPSNPNSLSNNSILSLTKDDHGKLWIGTSYGLNKLNPKDGKITRYINDPQDKSSISGNVIRDLYQDKNNILWVGTNQGLNRMDQSTGKFTLHRLRDESSGLIADISKICGGENNNLWVGEYFTGSIFRYEVDNRKSKFYSIANGVNDLFQDHNRTIWTATPSGLYKYDSGIDQFIALAHNPMIAITEDLDSNLWACSISDVYRINSNRDNIVKYSGQYLRRSGNLNATKASGYVDRDGNIIIGDSENYFEFHPNQIAIPPDTSKLYITNLLLGDNQVKATEGANIFENQKLNLPYSQNTFTLSFTEIDMRNPKRNKIKYMLENYDLDWRESLSEEKVTYMNVPPGEYNFKIRASNSSTGNWAENQISIMISPPWWRTWWAYIGYLIIIYFAGWQVHRFQKVRTIRQEREKTRERELEQAKKIEKAYEDLGEAHETLKATQTQLIQSEKMASLGELTAGIAHEIKNPLNFVNNFSEVNAELIDEMLKEIRNGDFKEVNEIAKDIKSNEEKIKHHGMRADSIVKNMLQHSRTSSGEMQLININALADEYLRLAYHGLRAKDSNFNCKMETKFDESIGMIEVIPQDIGRVFLNLITNAFQACALRQAQGNAERNRTPISKKLELENYSPCVKITTKVLPQSPDRQAHGDTSKGGNGSASNNDIEIRVSDNGSGIPDDIKDKIFQPFFTTKPTGEGTGLGLSMSYDIITKGHGGTLEVESKEGEGTEFIVRLPVV